MQRIDAAPVEADNLPTSFVSSRTGRVWYVTRVGRGYVICLSGEETTTMTARPFPTKREACEVLEYFRPLCLAPIKTEQEADYGTD